MPSFTESAVEEAALDWLHDLGYTILHGADIAPGTRSAERTDYDQVLLVGRLRNALERLNPNLRASALEDAYRKLTRTIAPNLLEHNRLLHRLLVNGVPVEYRRADGSIAGAQAQVIDYAHPEANDFLAVNQFTVVENKQERRAYIVLFINGIPLVVIELKNPADENADIWAAYRSLETYRTQIPSLFVWNAALVISDGLYARIGALLAGKEWFKPWRTIGGREIEPNRVIELQVLVQGILPKANLLDLVRHFIVFEDDGGKVIKKMAGYHQFHAVNAGVEETLRAAQLVQASRMAEARGHYRTNPQPGGKAGDHRIGVVWHTQGAGKSLTMAFYAGRLILHPAMRNPTIVVITDRNDLDDQLFGTFCRCQDLLRQAPVQVENRADLRSRLRVASGGVIFTTIQKFYPEERGDHHPLLSDRHNIVVIADEAHRSQYDFIDGFARNLHDALPNASFIGFTGTPIELTDANTRAVFGDYISVYDILQAVEDGATVPIYYESRLAKLEIPEELRPRIDPQFEEVTEGEEVERKEQLKTKWAQLEAVVGSDKRLDVIARDIVDHYEKRYGVMEGKAMIVCMSRRIAVELYDKITALRPSWHTEDDARGALKLVMTGSADDPLAWQPHIRNKARREKLADRFRNPADPFRVVIVRDMWLTGFDAPSLHTMYVDKPMRGHGLMQAIARVNRVFRDKPGGLIVDYLGLAAELKKALSDYTEQDRDNVGIPTEQALELLMEKYEVAAAMFHGFDYSIFFTGTPSQRLTLLANATDFILSPQTEKESADERKQRFMQAATELSKAFALVPTEDKAIEIREEVAFFQCIRAQIAKLSVGPDGGKAEEDLDHAVRQIISRAVASDQVIDIFAAAGMQQPNIAILSDEFLAEVQGMPQRNLALEMLRKLLNDDIRARAKKNLVQSRSFAEMLEKSIRAYQNRSLDAAQVIAHLVQLAKDMREAHRRGEDLGLSEDEVAFYDALEVNDSAVKVLGEPTLRDIARELVDSVRRNVTIDWTVKESARAKLRVLVKRILKKHGYPPDKQEKATLTVLEQAELLCKDWAV